MTYLLGALGIIWAILNIAWAYIFHRETLADSVTRWVKISGFGFVGMITPNITDFFEITNLILNFISKLLGAMIVAFGAWKAYKETFKEINKNKENDK